MRINVHSNGGYAAGGFNSNGGEVNAGTRARPTGIHDIINDLPQLAWPV